MTKFLKTKEEIESWLYSMQIEKFKINTDLSVDVDGDVALCRKNLQSIPIQFGVVKGGFYCFENNLKSLKGAPHFVGDIFKCNNNKIRTLEGSPRFVGAGFYCSDNKLISLEGVPEIINGIFDCSNNKNLGKLQEINTLTDLYSNEKNSSNKKIKP